MDLIIIPIVVAIIAGLAFYGGWFLNSRSGQNKIDSAQERAKRILEEAEKDANTLKKEKVLEAKDEWYRKKKEFEAEAQSKRNKLQTFEKQLISREENVDRKLDLLSKKESSLQTVDKEIGERRRKIEEKEKELEKLVEEENIRLERISGVSRDEAKKGLIENLIETVKTESAQMLKDLRDLGHKINAVLKPFFAERQMQLVDFKLEFGVFHNKLVLADEISPDTCRLWDMTTGDSMDKDRFRKDMGKIEEAYQEVLKRVRG